MVAKRSVWETATNQFYLGIEKSSFRGGKKKSKSDAKCDLVKVLSCEKKSAKCKSFSTVCCPGKKNLFPWHSARVSIDSTSADFFALDNVHTTSSISEEGQSTENNKRLVICPASANNIRITRKDFVLRLGKGTADSRLHSSHWIAFGGRLFKSFSLFSCFKHLNVSISAPYCTITSQAAVVVIIWYICDIIARFFWRYEYPSGGSDSVLKGWRCFIPLANKKET